MLPLGVLAKNFSVTSREQQQFTTEAENYMDNMPEGLQDRLSDAVAHAMHGFYSEVNLFRAMADTTGLHAYKVTVTDISPSATSKLKLRFYKSSQKTNEIKPLLIYFHGGGWSLGSVNATEKFCRALAAQATVNVVSVEYPLAPENKYPEALLYCKEATEYILSHAADFESNSQLVSIGGDGAGGNIALAVANTLDKKNNIRSLVLYYPLINTSGELNKEDKRNYGRGYGFDSRLWQAFIEAYQAGDNQMSSPLSPVLLIASGRDIIISQEREFAQTVSDITLVEFTGALHGFITDGQQPSAFNKAVELTSLFLKE